MTKFTYRLDGVLEIKIKLEKQAKMEFATAKARLNSEEDRLEEYAAALDEAEETLRRMMLDMLDIRKIRNQHAAIDFAAERVENQKLAVKRAAKQVDLAAAKLNTIMQERKSMEKLRKREFDEYMKDYNAELSKEVDELVSYKYVTGEE